MATSSLLRAACRPSSSALRRDVLEYVPRYTQRHTTTAFSQGSPLLRAIPPTCSAFSYGFQPDKNIGWSSAQALAFPPKLYGHAIDAIRTGCSACSTNRPSTKSGFNNH